MALIYLSVNDEYAQLDIFNKQWDSIRVKNTDPKYFYLDAAKSFYNILAKKGFYVSELEFRQYYFPEAYKRFIQDQSKKSYVCFDLYERKRLITRQTL